MIEFRGRAGTGTEHLLNVGGCGCGGEDCHNKEHSNKYQMKKMPNDKVGEQLDAHLRTAVDGELLGRVAEQAAEVYERVLARARKECPGVSLPEDEGKVVRADIVRETLIRTIMGRVQQERLRSQRLDSKEGGLLATPAGWKGKPLDSFLNETLSDLHTKGWAKQPKFFKDPKLALNALDEMKLLEYESFFRNADTSMAPCRSDRILWLSPDSLKKDVHPSLLEVLETLESLPFELNLKCSSFCQVPPAYQLSMFPANTEGYHKHFDGGDNDRLKDNGVKYTVMWFPVESDWNSERDGGDIILYDREEKTLATVELETNLLVILKSRQVGWEVSKCNRRRFSIVFYITGLQGPGDA